MPLELQNFYFTKLVDDDKGLCLFGHYLQAHRNTFFYFFFRSPSAFFIFPSYRYTISRNSRVFSLFKTKIVSTISTKEISTRIVLLFLCTIRSDLDQKFEHHELEKILRFQLSAPYVVEIETFSLKRTFNRRFYRCWTAEHRSIWFNVINGTQKFGFRA
jgi:hypothetical protein